jgi:CRISPR/Cas system-associated protein Cas5 (RAMP superfamily)
MYKFTIFACLSKEDHAFIEKYISPKGEVSLYKSIPIKYLDRVRIMLKNTGIKFRVKFRGPRYDLQRGTCLKANAHSFAIYPL